MTEKNTESKFPFMRAYNFLLEKSAKDLTPAEKMVLIVICRYWPSPYWDTNLTIAKNCGFTERYIEKIIKSLAKKGYVQRGYAHTDKEGKHHTVRVIKPLCFSEPCKKIIPWVSPEQMDGQQTEQTDGQCPNSRAFSPELQDDLLESKEKLNRKTMPAPLPAKGQAAALPEDKKTQSVSNVRQFINGFGSGCRKTPVLTPMEFEQKRQSQIRALKSG
jgi:predicted transcriptional regulator